VTKNAIRDHIRERLRQRSERATQGEVTVKSLTNEFARSPAIERLGLRPRMTAAQTARQLLEFAASHLPADQYRALTLWIQGASFDDIGAELAAPGPDAGRNLVRAAVAVLRRQFGASGA
jgi:hypothetical protein